MEYLLGLDGGGTKTIAVVADLRGNILGTGESGGSNYQTIGLDRAIASIKEASENASANAGIANFFKVACLGLAGAGRETDRALLLPALMNLKIADQVLLRHDAAIALAGATACQPGVVIIAGTGSMAFGMNLSGEQRRSGGWGNILGDEGSAYYISRRALAAACKAYDERGAKTALVEGLMKHLNLGDFTEIIRKIYSSATSPQDIAAIAPLVSQLAEKGDKISAEILKDAAEELALAVKAVIKGLKMENEKFQVATSGSVFSAGELLLAPFRESVKSTATHAEIICPKFNPATGALLLALQEIGVEIKEREVDNSPLIKGDQGIRIKLRK